MKYIVTMILILIVGILVATKDADITVAQVRPINVTRTVINAVDDSPDYPCFNEAQTIDKELPIGESIHTYIKEVCLYK